ncbi:hypothetical protein [Vibrio phage vB_VhaS-a]|nr:hypothetical protein [Vibrio phage vB_VhaS-a]
MKAQAIPKTLTKNRRLFKVTVYTWEGRTTVDLDEYVVVSCFLRKRLSIGKTKQVRAVKNDPKYVNSKGQLTGAYVSKYDELKFNDVLRDELPHGVYTTPLQAYKYAVEAAEEWLKRLESSEVSEEDQDVHDVDIAEAKKELKSVKAALTRYKKKQQTKK